MKDVQEKDRDSDKQAARPVEREKQQVARKAAAREHQKQYAAQKARQEAVRRQQQQQQERLTGQQQTPRQSDQPSLVAFGRSEPTQQIGFFGN